MKRKIAIAVAILMLLTCVVALAACGDEFTVTLDYGYDNKTETVTVGEGSIYVLPTLTRSGYTFAGWKDAGGKAVTGAQKIEADVTFTAQWTEGQSSVTVTFTVPTGAKAPDSKTAAPGDSITLPEGPEIEGQQFVGWELNEVLYEAGASVAIGKTNTTFTAVYANEVQIRYIITIAGAKAPAMEYALGGEIIEIEAAPQIDGYVFMGWKLANGKTYQAGDLMLVTGEEEMVVLTADYREAVTLTFNYGEDKSFTMLAAKKGAFTMPDLELDADHVLKGWLLDGEGEPIAAGTTILTPDEDASYTAEIKALYTVRIYDEKGQLLSTQRVEEGEDAVMPVYQYPKHLDGDPWYINYGGLDHELTNVTESFEARPIYDAVPLDESIFTFVAVSSGNAYQVAYVDYANGMNAVNITELVLPSTHDGKPVTGVYCSVTAFGGSVSASTGAMTYGTNSKKGGFALSTILQRVYIPACYTSLGANAFLGDEALEEVVFGEGSQLTSIGVGAFAGCSSLASFTIPSEVATIGQHAFRMTALNAINIPGKVATIDQYAFADIQPLATVTFAESDVGLTFANYAFANLKPIAGDTAAQTATRAPRSLTSFTFPARTVKIGQYVLQYNLSLAELKFAAPTGTAKDLTIDQNAFAAASQTNQNAATAAYPFSASLKSITIPARTVSIGNGAFADQIFIEELNFGTGIALTTLGTRSFFGLVSLKTLNIPQGMITTGNIPDGAFGIPGGLSETAGTGCIGYYTEASPVTALLTEKNKASLTTVTIPEGIKTITQNAFYGQGALATVNFPASLETLGNNSFWLPSGVENTALTTLTMPRGLKSYGNTSVTAFRGSWFGIQTVTFDCPNLTQITGIGDGWVGEGQAYSVIFKNLGTVTITSCFSKSNVQSVQFQECDNAKITFSKSFVGADWSANNGLTRNASLLTSVSLPADITIDADSFTFLEKLTSMTFGAGSKYSFANGALYMTEDETKTLVRYMWSNVVWADETDVVGTVAVPDAVTEGVTVIAANAFKGMPVTSIKFAESVKTIGNAAFQNHRMTSIYVPATVELVDTNAFNNGKQLISVECHAKQVNANAFSGAPLLETITFGEEVENIAAWTVIGWPNQDGANMGLALKEVILLGNTAKFTAVPAATFTTAVTHADSKFKIYVDSAALPGYQELLTASWAQVSEVFVTEMVTVTFGEGEQATTAQVIKGGWIAPSKIPEGEWEIAADGDGEPTPFDPSQAITDNLTLQKVEGGASGQEND